jgi:peptide/nickel transport system permease protein
VIGDYVWPTVVLLSTATVLSAVIGIAIGIRGGWKRGSAFDRTSTGITLTLYAMPEFWLGMVLLILFSTGVGPFPGIFPSGGTITRVWTPGRSRASSTSSGTSPSRRQP